MAETTPKKTVKKTAKPKAKTASVSSESVIATPTTKKGVILGAALVVLVLFSMIVGS